MFKNYKKDYVSFDDKRFSLCSCSMFILALTFIRNDWPICCQAFFLLVNSTFQKKFISSMGKKTIATRSLLNNIQCLIFMSFVELFPTLAITFSISNDLFRKEHNLKRFKFHFLNRKKNNKKHTKIESIESKCFARSSVFYGHFHLRPFQFIIEK